MSSKEDCLRKALKIKAYAALKEKYLRKVIDDIDSVKKSDDAIGKSTAETTDRVRRELKVDNDRELMDMKRNLIKMHLIAERIMNSPFKNKAELVAAYHAGTEWVKGQGTNHSFDLREKTLQQRYAYGIFTALNNRVDDQGNRGTLYKIWRRGGESRGFLRKSNPIGREVRGAKWHIEKGNKIEVLKAGEKSGDGRYSHNAIEIAKAELDVEKMMRADLADAGILRKELPGHVVDFRMEQDILLKLAKESGRDIRYSIDGKPIPNSYFDVWYRDNINELDWKATFGLKMNDPQARFKFMVEYYKTVTSGMSDSKAGSAAKGTVVSKFNKQRQLHYKSGEAIHDALGRYGDNGLYKANVAKTRRVAKGVAQLDFYGTDPKTFNSTLREILRERIKEGQGPVGLKNFDSQINKMDSLFDRNVSAQDVRSSKGWAAAEIVVKGVTAAIQLGKAPFTASADFMALAINFPSHTGVPIGKAWLQTSKAIFKSFTSGEFKKQNMLDVAFMVDEALDYHRDKLGEYRSGDDGMAGVANGMARLMNFASGLQFLTNSMKHAATSLAMVQLARVAHKPFHQLHKNMQVWFKSHDITPEMWDVMRKTPLRERKDGKMILAVSDIDTTTEVGRASRDNYQMMLSRFNDTASPTPGARQADIARARVKSGTIGGFFLGTSSQYFATQLRVFDSILSGINMHPDKGFRVDKTGESGFHLFDLSKEKKQQKMFGRDVEINERVMVGAAGTLIAMLGMTYMSDTLRDMTQGKNPRALWDDDGNPHNKNILYFIRKSGFAPIYGDLLAGMWHAYGQNASSTFSAAGAGQFDNLFATTSSALHEGVTDPKTKRAFGDLVGDAIPYKSLWYLKPLGLDALLFDTMGSIYDDEYRAKKEEKAVKGLYKDRWQLLETGKTPLQEGAEEVSEALTESWEDFIGPRLP